MNNNNRDVLLKIAEAIQNTTTIEQAVDNWLTDHPEATTTVQDGSITKAKLDENLQETVDDVSDLKSAFEEVEDWIGYDVNYIDGRLFTSSNSTNWTIVSATKDSIAITHNNTYSTGSPRISLEGVLKPSTTYKFRGTFSNSTYNAVALWIDGTYVDGLVDGSTFTTPSSFSTIQLVYAPSASGSFSITGMYLGKETLNGVVQQIEEDIDDIEENAAFVEMRVEDLENGLDDITVPVFSDLTGTETQDKCIVNNGTISTAGSTNFRIVKYEVTPNRLYIVSASANYGNRLYAYYDSSDNLVELGTRSETGSSFTVITDEETTAPSGASYILVSYNVTSGGASCKTETGKKIVGKWAGKKWVCVGDSLTEVNETTSKRYYDYITELTDISVVNMGVSGSGYARLSGENKAFYQRISSCPTDADVVTIFGSFNDLGAGLNIGTVTDNDTTTLAGCINKTIDNLQAIIPLVNLGIVAPTPWDTTPPATSGQAYNYVNMLKQICEHRSIPFLNLWLCSNLRPWDSDFREVAYSHDGGSGTHPDENGHKIIAPRFEWFLDSLLIH